MSEYRDTIKSMAKVRGYMRDLYVYGFRTRRDFERKSARTYDNERRRIESWLGDYIRFDHSAKGKSVCISLDSAAVENNPLFVAWRSKSYTDNDIVLHFLLTDALAGGGELSAPELTERLSAGYDAVFDLQTVRGKLREYEREGIVTSRKEGKALRYRLCSDQLSQLPHSESLTDAVAFFSQTAVGGYIGSTIMAHEEGYTTPVRYKHNYIAHTQDDGVALELLDCAREGRKCRIKGISKRNRNSFDVTCVPLRILDSVQTGRRYVVVYDLRPRRLTSLRLDCIDSIEQQELYPDADKLRELERETAPMRWGVSYNGSRRTEQLCLKLHIDERTEQHVLRRIEREGRGGELLHIDKDTYLYTVEVFDTNEAMPWVKTFVGRIISFECSNRAIADKFYGDMQALREMYCGEEDE